MARQPFRAVRGTAAQVAAYAGPMGEIVANQDTRELHLQDGATPGGRPLLAKDGAGDLITVAPLSGPPKTLPATVRHPAVLDVTRDLSCPYDGSSADVGAILNDAVARVAASPTGGTVLVNPGIYNVRQTVFGRPNVKIATPGLGQVQIRRFGDFGPTFKWQGSASGFSFGGGIDGFWIFDWDHTMTAANSGQHVVFDYCDRPVIGAMRYDNGGGGLGLYSCSSARVGAQDGKFFDFPNDGTRAAGRIGIKIDKTSIPGVSYPGGDYAFSDTIEMAGSLSDNATASLESAIHLGCGDGIRFQGYTHCIYTGYANVRLKADVGKQLTNIGFANLFGDICAASSIVIDGDGYVDGLDIVGKCSTLGSGSGFTAEYAVRAPALVNNALIRLTQMAAYSRTTPVLLNPANNGVTLEVPLLRARDTWKPGPASNSEATRDITVIGARPGDLVQVGTVPGDLAGLVITGYIPNADNVRVVLSSPYGSIPDVGTLAVYVEVLRRFR